MPYIPPFTGYFILQISASDKKHFPLPHAGCAGWLHALFPVMVFAEKSILRHLLHFILAFSKLIRFSMIYNLSLKHGRLFVVFYRQIFSP